MRWPCKGAAGNVRALRSALGHNAGETAIAEAILFVYAMRRQRLALAVFVPLNVLLLAATPTVGGHYLVDLSAGAIIAVASIAVTRVLRRRGIPEAAIRQL